MLGSHGRYFSSGQLPNCSELLGTAGGIQCLLHLSGHLLVQYTQSTKPSGYVMGKSETDGRDEKSLEFYIFTHPEASDSLHAVYGVAGMEIKGRLFGI